MYCGAVYFAGNVSCTAVFRGGIYMAFDGIVISNIVYDMNRLLTGGRIYKIYQPEADELLDALGLPPHIPRNSAKRV